MTIGLVGKKAGMTRVFSEDGQAIPVTVIEVPTQLVTQIKTQETDGYQAIQVTYGEKKASRVSKPAAGHFAKAGVQAGRGLLEFRTEERGLLLVKGAVPGATGGDLIVKPAVKVKR